MWMIWSFSLQEGFPPNSLPICYNFATYILVSLRGSLLLGRDSIDCLPKLFPLPISFSGIFASPYTHLSRFSSRQNDYELGWELVWKTNRGEWKRLSFNALSSRRSGEYQSHQHRRWSQQTLRSTFRKRYRDPCSCPGSGGRWSWRA